MSIGIITTLQKNNLIILNTNANYDNVKLNEVNPYAMKNILRSRTR